MRPMILLGLLLTAVGCVEKKHSSLKMGQTTRSDLVTSLGEPISETSASQANTKILLYKNNEKFQVKGDLVVNRFSDPSGDQKKVIWWKHKFKDCLTGSRKLDSVPGSHVPGEIEFSCPAEGLSVIYSDGSDVIGRVVEFEKK